MTDVEMDGSMLHFQETIKSEFIFQPLGLHLVFIMEIFCCLGSLDLKLFKGDFKLGFFFPPYIVLIILAIFGKECQEYLFYL